MKKILVTGAAIAMALSCSNDDDGGGNVSVQGTWNLTKFELTQELDLNNDGDATDNLIEESNCYTNSTVTFDSDNSVTFHMESIDVDLNATETGYEYTVTCDSGTPSAGTYTVADNIITVDMGGDPIAFTRSGNKITFAIPESVSVPVEEDGEITNIQVGAYFEFTKE